MISSKDQFLQLRESEAALPNELQGISFEHLIDAKKENFQAATKAIIENIIEGNYDSLKALILAKKGIEFFTTVEKSVRPLAEDKYIFKIGKDYSIHDVKIEEAESGVKYDYSACNDPEWNVLNKQAIELDKLIKQRETFLKGITKPLEIVDTDTGETSTLLPPLRTGKLGLKLTIK